MSSSIPGKPISGEQSDLTGPVADLLEGLNLLGSGSDDAVNVLESKATNISKVVGSAVATLGGLSAVIAAVGAFWDKQANDVRMTIIIAMAAVLAASVVALGWIITVDLRTRLDGQNTLYELRREFAFKFIDDAVQFQTSTTGAATAAQTATAPVAQALSPMGERIFRLAVDGADLRVTLRDKTSGRLTGYGQRNGQPVVRVLDENNQVQWPSPDDVEIPETVAPVDIPGQPKNHADGGAGGAGSPVRGKTSSQAAQPGRHAEAVT